MTFCDNLLKSFSENLKQLTKMNDFLLFLRFHENRRILHCFHRRLLLLLLLSDRLQTPTDRAKCHKPEGTSKEGNPKKEKINKNEGKKDKNTI